MSRIRHFAPLAVLLLLPACGPQPAEMAGPPELIARQTLFGNPDKSRVRLSPDGSKISYTADVDGVLNVWVGPVDDPAAAKPVTNDTGRGIRRYFWAFTNQHVLYLQDIGGDENWRLYSVDLESGETRDLTPIDGVQVRIQEVSHKNPEEILVAVNQRSPQLHDVYRLNIASGEMEMLVENPGYMGFASDSDYNVPLATRVTPDGGMVVDRKGEEGWSEFLRIGQEDSLTTGTVGFDASGEVCYMIDSRGRDTAALVAMNLASGESEVLHEDPRADVNNALVHPTELTVQAAASTFERREWKVLDESIRADLEYLATVADGELEVVDRTLDDGKWIVGYELADRPYSYYLYDRPAKRADFLFTNRAAIEDVTLAPQYSAVIKARDGLDLVSYLTLPVEADADKDGRPESPVPMVLLVHGGPWARDNWGYDGDHQWLANRGYAVMSVNFRGSTGLGKAHTNAGDLEWGAKMHDDLVDAVEWAVAEGVTAADKVAIMGGSYGGYATLAGLTFTPETFACGVDIVGPSNLVSLVQAIPPYWKPMIEMFASRMGDWRTEEGREFLTQRSPLTHVDKIARPLLIGQGANDPRVPQVEADQIVDAMKAREIPVTYALFPDEGHGFARPENNMAFNAVTEAFLAECLGGRVEAVGDDFEGSSIQVLAGADGVPGLSEALPAPVEEPAASEEAAAAS
jgi:dipeptidyl aminopeptidase/acylaminoacyl peptidase